jgi:hypothetical protein
MIQLSPRFLALPAIALAVIVGLANAQGEKRSGAELVAGATVVRAVNCTLPANSTNAACAVADRGAGTAVR